MTAYTGLPAELLYTIIAWTTVEHIDDVILGPLKLPSLSVLEQARDTARQPTEAEDPSLTAVNPVLPFFYVSCQFRATVLKILSNALAISLAPVSGHVDR